MIFKYLIRYNTYILKFRGKIIYKEKEKKYFNYLKFHKNLFMQYMDFNYAIFF